jgi:hypothetical protein
MVVVMVEGEKTVAGMGLDWVARFGRDGGRRGYSRIEVEWQERISLRARTTAAAHFHCETQNENPGEAGGKENRKGENVHGRGILEIPVAIASSLCAE